MTTTALRLRVHRLRATKTLTNADGCWVWQGTQTSQGYGTAKLPGSSSSTTAHRLFYEALVGPIPMGTVIHHRCTNRLCVNPDHLAAVSAVANGAESYERKRLAEALASATEALDAVQDAHRQDHDHEEDDQ